MHATIQNVAKKKKKRNVYLNLLKIMIICILRDGSRLFACGLLPETREIGEVCGSGRNCRYRNSR